MPSYSELVYWLCLRLPPFRAVLRYFQPSGGVLGLRRTARAMFSGVSGMGGGMVFFTGRPRGADLGLLAVKIMSLQFSIGWERCLNDAPMIRLLDHGGHIFLVQPPSIVDRKPNLRLCVNPG